MGETENVVEDTVQHLDVSATQLLGVVLVASLRRQVNHSSITYDALNESHSCVKRLILTPQLLALALYSIAFFKLF